MCGFSGVIKTLAEHFGGAQHGHKGVQVFLVDKLPQLHCFVPGQGIVARSQDEYELQEVNNKLGALKKAIDLAVNLKN